IFCRLVNEAKKRGIAIILDGVFSHTGCDSIYFNRFDNFPEIGAYQSPDSPYAKWYTFIEGRDCTKYECWWGVDDLPNVDEMNPSYQNFIYGGEDSVVRHWLKAGVSGWRLDVADELPDEFIKELRHAVKETDPEAVLIGEVWEDASNKVSYGKLREYLWGEELDSTMNYPFRSIFLDFILGKIDAPMAHKRIMSLYENYPRENFYAAMNLIGSHDRERVLTLLGEAPPGEKLTEKEKEEFRMDATAREIGFKRLKILSLIQMTFPGVPCVYYGDETGMEGYTDPYNRGTYPWGMEDQEILSWYRRIIRLRREYQVFRDGGFESLYPDRDVYGFRRTGGTEQIIVLVNRNLSEEKILKADLVEETGYKDKVLILDLLAGTLVGKNEFLKIPPLEGRIIYLKSVPRDPAAKKDLPKGCGILLHITSLPSLWGVGDMGEEAYRFVDFLAAAGHTIWQILPLNPPGLGNSPYQSYSAFAGNDLLLDIGHLTEEGLLDGADVRQELEKIQKEIKDLSKASFELTARSKEKLYHKAYQKFQAMIKETGQVDVWEKSAYLSSKNYHDFQMQHRFWLKDYCLYAALKKYYGGVPWDQWAQGAVERHTKVLHDYRNKFVEEINYQCFLQYTFFMQWKKLKDYANAKGIYILGDLPIYVSPDSCDVWVNRKFFSLNHEGRPGMVAGVPPDYFSPTGQLWGNPIYHWEEMAKEGYSWWIERVRHSIDMYDYLRLDHFRGFEAFWAVPGGEETAVNGLWLKGPGKKLFEVLAKKLGDLPFIAEDLGVITPEVNNLKHIFGFPGMMVFQFSGQEMPEEEKNPNMVYYTGTHDNDTLVGWCREQSSTYDSQSIVEKLYRSDAVWVIVPLQDILGLDSEARMNTPGIIYGNWEWRMDKSSLTEGIRAWLRELSDMRYAT
ncbi:MAG: 4-alpha-glucanotransferase, partial [Dehalobacterium sp.]